MLHKFFEPGDWFAPKKLGYGAGLPIAWQGWVLVAVYIACALVFAVLMETGDFVFMAIGVGFFIAVTVGFVLIAKARTKGGWRFRRGGED